MQKSTPPTFHTWMKVKTWPSKLWESSLGNIHIWKIFTPERYSHLKNIPPWKIFLPEKYSPLKDIPPWKIFTPENYSPRWPGRSSRLNDDYSIRSLPLAAAHMRHAHVPCWHVLVIHLMYDILCCAHLTHTSAVINIPAARSLPPYRRCDPDYKKFLISKFKSEVQYIIIKFKEER